MPTVGDQEPGATSAASWRFPRTVHFVNACEIVEQASAVLERGAPAAMGGQDVVRFDLSGCESFDSSLLAILLELERRAQARNRKCRFGAPPPPLLELADLYGIGSLLFDAAAVPRRDLRPQPGEPDDG